MAAQPCHLHRLVHCSAVRRWLSLIAYNLGNLWRRPGAAEEDRELVADQFAGSADEDGRETDQACAVLLADGGREPSDAAVVREDDPSDQRAGGGDWVSGRR